MLDMEGIEKIIELDGLNYVSISILVMYLAVFVFSYLKVKLLFKISNQSGHPSASEFTVMVKGVDRVPENPANSAIKLMNNLMEKSGYERLEVAEVVIARPSGLLRRAESFLELERMKLQSLLAKKSNYLNQTFTSRAQVEMARKSYQTVKKEIKKNLKYLRKRVRKMRRDEIMISYKDRWSLAFISFETDRQKQRILSLIKLNRKNSLPLSFLCKKKKNEHRISTALEPLDVSWENIGETELRYKSKTVRIRILMFLLSPVLDILFMLSTICFFYLQYAVDILSLDISSSIFSFLCVKLFSFVTVKVADYLIRNDLSYNRDHLVINKIVSVAYGKATYALIIPVLRVLFDSVDEGVFKVFDYSSYQHKYLKYLLSGVYLTPLLLLADFKYLISIFLRWRISSKLWVRGKNKGNSNYYWMTQEQVNQYFNRPESKIELKYLRNLSLMLLMGLTSLTAPLISASLIFLNISLSSVVEIYLFYYRYKKPRRTPEVG